jgi:hypothetical protein
MSALEKVLALSRPGAPAEDDGSELPLALAVALDELRLYLASSGSGDDGDDDSSGGDDSDEDGQGSGHSDHATYKALVKKGVKPVLASKMCARADKKVKASALIESVYVMLSAEDDPVPEPTYLARMVALAAPPGESAEERRKSASKGHALPDGSYPIPDKKHLHSAAVLAASKHGNWQAAKRLIRKRARELGVELSSLPGFGGDSENDKKVAASMVLELSKASAPVVPMHHPPFTGTHSHGHHLTAAHDHEHQHFNDNDHGGGPQHRPGSSSAVRRFGEY